LLVRFSPTVEAAGAPAGLFWLDPSGMSHLYRSHAETLFAWAVALHHQIASARLTAAVVVGFHRWRLFAVARACAPLGPLALRDADAERQLAEGTLLAQLDLPPKLRDELALLGVQSLGDLLSIPRHEIQTRYGKAAAELHALLLDPALPLRPWRAPTPLCAECGIEPAD